MADLIGHGGSSRRSSDSYCFSPKSSPERPCGGSPARTPVQSDRNDRAHTRSTPFRKESVLPDTILSSTVNSTSPRSPFPNILQNHAQYGALSPSGYGETGIPLSSPTFHSSYGSDSAFSNDDQLLVPGRLENSPDYGSGGSNISIFGAGMHLATGIQNVDFPQMTGVGDIPMGTTVQADSSEPWSPFQDRHSNGSNRFQFQDATNPMSHLSPFPNPPQPSSLLSVDTFDTSLESSSQCKGSKTLKSVQCTHNPCGQVFTSTKDMKRHRQSVHNLHKPYRCPFCGSFSSRKDNCQRHIRNQHQSEATPVYFPPSPHSS